MRHVIIFYLLLFLSGTLRSQIFYGDLHLPSQQSVEDFPSIYPNIKKIYGDLILGSTDTLTLSDITDLTPLAQLTYADGLYIINNGLLANLNWLQQIDTLDTFFAWRNPGLTALTGLDNLVDVYSIVILDNDSLKNLTGLERLKFASNLNISKCDNLESLEGLDSLENIFSTTYIEYNSRLKTLTGMPSLQHSTTWITGNDSLAHFGYFPALRDAGFLIKDNKNLIDFTDMNGKHPDLKFGVGVYDCPKLESFLGLEKAKLIGLNCVNNAIITSVSGFDSLLELRGLVVSSPLVDSIHFERATNIGSINIFENPALKKLNTVFPNAKTQNNFFEIYDNPALKEIINLFPVADSINAFTTRIYNNDSLLVIHEDVGPKYIKSLEIKDNDTLAYITGFEGLQYTGNTAYDNLYFSSNYFRKINGFNSLKTTNSIQVILGNYSPDFDFEELTGFNTLDSLYSSFDLDNHNVYALDMFPRKMIGFSTLKFVGEDLRFEGIRDTFSGFQMLEQIGKGYPASPSVQVGIGDSCKVNGASFEKLHTIKRGGITNAYKTGYLFKFPELSIVDDGIATYGNRNNLVFQGIYPKLFRIGHLYSSLCTSLKSFDGLEGIQQFRMPLGSNSNFQYIYLENNDSLTDCSAICYLINHASFSDPIPEPYYINNPLAPCNDVPTLLAWCDTLTTGIPDLPAAIIEKPGMRLYPNPVTGDILYLDATEMGSGRYPVQVVDASGQRVLAGSFSFSEGKASLNVSALANGWYALQAGSGSTVYSAAFLRWQE